MPRKARLLLLAGDENTTLAVVLPTAAAEHIRATASRNLSTVSAWLRSAVLDRLARDGVLADDDAAEIAR